MSVQAPRSGHEVSGESESYLTSGKMSEEWCAGTNTCVPMYSNHKHALKTVS